MNHDDERARRGAPAAARVALFAAMAGGFAVAAACCGMAVYEVTREAVHAAAAAGAVMGGGLAVSASVAVLLGA